MLFRKLSFPFVTFSVFVQVDVVAPLGHVAGLQRANLVPNRAFVDSTDIYFSCIDIFFFGLTNPPPTMHTLVSEGFFLEDAIPTFEFLLYFHNCWKLFAMTSPNGSVSFPRRSRVKKTRSVSLSRELGTGLHSGFVPLGKDSIVSRRKALGGGGDLSDYW